MGDVASNICQALCQILLATSWNANQIRKGGFRMRWVTCRAISAVQGLPDVDRYVADSRSNKKTRFRMRRVTWRAMPARPYRR